MGALNRVKLTWTATVVLVNVYTTGDLYTSRSQCQTASRIPVGIPVLRTY